ncbi:hypothetical protein [Streptomyces sp. SID8352]|uniref:hypothetical protein n=1 Tax=Streptomyces sp. SID8352 TaxID=2690338 RepID=UPI00136819BD|nr:hypothetical protein [Streptomyces sp. SID8352]MYU24532.1 hypothetical protein [Streptomyces sp. SID8352]
MLVLARAPSGERVRTGTDRAVAAHRLTMALVDGPRPVADPRGTAPAAGRLLADQVRALMTEHGPTRARPAPPPRSRTPGNNR